MRSLSKSLVLAGLLLLPTMNAAYADPWQEREVLSRVREQLIRIDKLLNQAQQAGADNQTRLRMEYGPIRQDLRTIEQGIMQYISAPMEPADIEPLDGGYTKYQRATKASVTSAQDKGAKQ